MKNLIALIFMIGFCLSPNAGSNDGSFMGRPTGLMCELLRFPEKAVITDAMPDFGWIVNDVRRGARQTAYQILVASSLELLKKNLADAWDSGKVQSDKSVNVEYAGKNLAENSSYWWKVRNWDAEGKPSPFSGPQKFNTGVFRRSQRWPGESHWVTISDSGRKEMVLENRQHAEFHEIVPVQLTEKSPGHYFVDFGKAAFATLKLKLSSEKSNDSVKILLGEKQTTNNRIDRNPGRSIGFKELILPLERGTHSYIVHLPRHVAHSPNSQVLPAYFPEVIPFRFAEIIGSPSQLKKTDIRQMALFYPFDYNVSSFRCSNENLNRVWELCKYTLKATPFLSLYCDGNRERMPYEADAHIQQLGHYSVDREYSLARYTYQFLIYNPSWPTEWQMHVVPMAWADFLYTGNRESLEKYYNDLKAKTLIALEGSDGLISSRTGLVTPAFLESIHYTGKSFRDIVDWPAGTAPGEKQAGNRGPTLEGERDGYVFTDFNTVVNAFHYRNLVLMEKISGVLGKTSDQNFFRQRKKLVRKNFNRAFFRPARGIYVDGKGTDHASLHANMFPLAFGLVPGKQMERVVKFIKSRGMACSVYGAQFLLEALYNAGEAQYALDLMSSDSRRSWMNMIHTGSTMTTEAWDIYYKPNMTWNHAWGSAPANIVVRKLMGIEPLEPAFRKIKIKPQVGNLTFLHLKTPTIRGPVQCDWQQNGNQFTLKIKIPANTSAVVYLPTTQLPELKESGKKISQVSDIIFNGIEGNFSKFKVLSGEYSFSGTISR